MGAGGSHRTEMSIIRALRSLGYPSRLIDVVWWCRRLGPLGPRVVHALTEQFRPDAVILTRHAARLGENLVRRITSGRAGGVWFLDLTVPPSASVVGLAKAAGRLFLTCHSQLEAYRACGLPEVHYLPQGVDPEFDRPVTGTPAKYRCDLSFVGSGQYAHRHDLLRRVARVGRLQIRGRGWGGIPDLPVVGGPVYGRAFARVVRGASISLGAHATSAQDRQCACASNRIWKVLGCGGFYLGPAQRGMDSFARDREHCAWYHTVEEAVELCSRYLGEPDLREQIADAGRAHALRHHTYRQRVELLLAGRSYPLTPG